MLVSSPAPLGVVTSPTGGGLLGLGGLSVYIYRGFVRLRDLYASCFYLLCTDKFGFELGRLQNSCLLYSGHNSRTLHTCNQDQPAVRTGIHCTHGHQVECCDFVVLCRLISVKCDYTHSVVVN